MALEPPSLETLGELADRYGLELSRDDLVFYRRLIEQTLPSYHRLDQLAEPRPPVRYPRTSGWRPQPEDNPLNAWYWRCSIKGAEDGPLAGKRVAVKDSACLAGIPMMNGASWLEGTIPDVDATAVTRLLDAGAEVLGKAVCEHLCLSDSSYTSDTGPVLNPQDPTRSAGGSSSGSAALVVAGECDIALGGDQAGSIRTPSSFCGAYGLKPTYGLVPYTGVGSIERTVDHIGPITGTVQDLALALEAIAGPDGLDPRQVDVRVDDYTGTLEHGIEGLRVGMLEEGFGWRGADPVVEDTVRATADRLQELGATVESVSVPMHRESVHIWSGIYIEGNLVNQIRGNTQGIGAKGFYNTTLIDAFRRARRQGGADFSVTVKFVVLLGEYLHERYGGHYYAKARNLATTLTRAYDEALATYDVLVMPTTPIRAPKLPDPGASPQEIAEQALEVYAAMCGFDVSGHPAISIPVGPVDGLPVGFMAIGRTFGDATLLRLARACEASGVAMPVGVASAADASPAA
jgi:amidase